MEIFLRNIEEQASPKSLKKFLREKLRPFEITTFECYKLKNRTCAILVVLDKDAGHRFIQYYSHQRNRLQMIRQTIRVESGKHHPDPFLLKTLDKRSRDLDQAKRKSTLLSRKGVAKFEFVSVECGVWNYRDEDLIFVSHFHEKCSGILKLGDKALTLSAPPLGQADTLKRIDIQYSGINTVATGESTITLTLERAPKVYKLAKDYFHNQKYQSTRICAINEAHKSVIAYCMVYRIQLYTPIEVQEFQDFLAHKQGSPGATPWPYSMILATESFSSQMEALSSELKNLENVSFALKFQLQRLASNCYLLPRAVIGLLPHVTDLTTTKGATVVAHALERLLNQIPFAGPETEARELSLETIMESLRQNIVSVSKEPPVSYTLAKRYPNMVLVHKVFIKPSGGIYLGGPDIESKNRVLRRYANPTAELFLRITFSDEDEKSVKFDYSGSMAEIHQMFKEILNSPIVIAGHNFDFLGFSNSSLREQCCWFMEPIRVDGKFLTARDVIAQLGDFSTIRCPAKCAARIGQAFTDTPLGTLKLAAKEVYEIPDVERNGRTFSDGCGTISQELVNKLWSKRAFKRSQPTLFQIRYGGSKGMLSLDSTLQGSQLKLRRSMIKFPAPHTDVEICGCAGRALPLYLNRQIIKVLEDLGVKADTFLELQAAAVKKLRMTTNNPINASALLDRSSVGKSAKLPWFILHLYYIDLSYLQDSFLRQCVEHTVLSELRMLKHKARIPVEDGVTLYGILDETNTLRENEIFCRPEEHIIVGTVAVTRSPALDPGDVQVVQAVDVPDDSPLKQLHNCIVFSQRGERDLPSKLSGGDLDGDLYNVFFSECLRPTKIFAPAEYPRVDPVDIGRVVNVKDMTDFFVDFMANDQLSRIAMQHVQFADADPQGVLSDYCLHLASLHSIAVDFQKTGIPVSMSSFPKPKYFRPDFMAPGPRVDIVDGLSAFAEEDEVHLSDDEDDPDAAIDPDAGFKKFRYYESEKVLGRLYRAIDEKAFLEEIQSQARAAPASGGDLMQQLYKYCKREAAGIEFMHLCPWARDIRYDYDEIVNDLRHTYSTSRHHLITEVEVFTGSILGNEEGALPSKRMTEASKTMKENFDDSVQHILGRIVNGSQDDEDDGDPGVLSDDSLERSLACFYVALEERHDSLAKLRSFRYIAGMACLHQVEVFRISNGNTPAISEAFRNLNIRVADGSGISGGKAHALGMYRRD